MIRGVAITPSGPLCLADNAILLLIDEAQYIGSDWIFVNSYLAVVDSHLTQLLPLYIEDPNSTERCPAVLHPPSTTKRLESDF